MKVFQIVGGISGGSSGPSYSVPALCGGLNDVGIDVELCVPGDLGGRSFAFQVRSFRREDPPFLHIGRCPSMERYLKANTCAECLVHSNGLWLMSNIYPSRVKRTTRCKLVMAPRGTLAEWSLRHHWLRKKLFGWFCGQYAAMTVTDMWHATCEKEYEEIRALGYRQPVAIVPIGMDVPEIEPRNTLNTRNEGRRVVFFGRLHKVKGVDRLLRAWEKVAKDGWELVIAGPDCGMLEELKGIVAELRLPHVSFVGEINGQAKYEFLANADIYVLPSDTENFGVTVAEALACGTPVIASQGTPWKGLEIENAGRWIPIGVEPLVAALREMMAMSDEERAAMGVRGREWIRRDFSWKGVGTKMKVSYEWLLGKRDRPECVKVD